MTMAASKITVDIHLGSAVNLADLAEADILMIANEVRLNGKLIRLAPATAFSPTISTGAAWEEKAIDLYRSGVSVTKTAKAFRVAQSKVRDLLIERGIPRRPNGSRGDGVSGPSSERDTEMAALYRDGHTMTMIARKFRLSPPTVRKILVRCGVELRSDSRPKLSRVAAADRKAKMCRAYWDGKSLREIANCFGVSHERVRQLLEQAGVRMRERYNPGAPTPSSDQRAEIVRAYQSGMTLGEVADRLQLKLWRVRQTLQQEGVERRRPGPSHKVEA